MTKKDPIKLGLFHYSLPCFQRSPAKKPFSSKSEGFLRAKLPRAPLQKMIDLLGETESICHLDGLVGL